MGNLIKVIIFLIVLAGIGIYIFNQIPEISETINYWSQKSFLNSLFKPLILKPTYQVAPAKISSNEQKISGDLIPEGFSGTQLSPYFKKIKIVSVSAFSNNNPGYIRIFSYLNKGETIDITGWKIKSNQGEIIIPKAINVYEPSGWAAEKDIILAANDYVNIYSGKNPLGKNFRLNKCIGYLENIYNFNPSLPRNCPAPYKNRSEIAHLSNECQSYIMSLRNCELPESSFYNSLAADEQGNICRQFLNTINYNSCYQKHRFDSDFLSNEWWLWIDQDVFFKDISDSSNRLLFFDNQGLLVDEYFY